MPKELNPIKRMAYLDTRGDAYHLSDIRLADGSTIPGADVYSHDSGWMELHVMGDKERMWLNVACVISMTVVEG